MHGDLMTINYLNISMAGATPLPDLNLYDMV